MEIKKLIIIFLLTFLLTSCNSLFINKSKQIRLAKEYQKECLDNRINNKLDTIQLTSNRFCIKKSNNKFAIGKIRNNQKRGLWYYYNKKKGKYECYLIQKRLKNDSIIIYRSSIVNYRKW